MLSQMVQVWGGYVVIDAGDGRITYQDIETKEEITDAPYDVRGEKILLPVLVPATASDLNLFNLKVEWA